MMMYLKTLINKIVMPEEDEIEIEDDEFDFI